MGGGVHLDHVDMTAFHDRLAVLAELFQLDRRLVDGICLVIEAASENPGGGGLADAAHPGQHIGLGNAAGLEGVGQRAYHRLLSDHQVGEVLGAVLARQNAVSGVFFALLFDIGHCHLSCPVFDRVFNNSPCRAALSQGAAQSGRAFGEMHRISEAEVRPRARHRHRPSPRR